MMRIAPLARPASSVGLISWSSLRRNLRQAGSAQSNNTSRCRLAFVPSALGSACNSTQQQVTYSLFVCSAALSQHIQRRRLHT